MIKSGLHLWFSGFPGLYTPRDFVSTYYDSEIIDFDKCKEWGLLESDTWWQNCINPESEYYWESWQYILENAKHIDENGYIWRLHQGGDLWVYCLELMTSEEKSNFGFSD